MNRHLLFPLLLAVLILLGSCSGSQPTAPETHALSDTGLPGLTLAVHALYGNSHGGFHGDGETWVVFEVPYRELDDLWEHISGSDGWTVESISMADYDARAQGCTCCFPAYYPRPGTVFDAWYFRDDEPSEYARNETLAFYDRETGLFVYFRIDT